MENRKYYMIPKNFVSTYLMISLIVLTLSISYSFIKMPSEFRQGTDTALDEINYRIQNIEDMQDTVESHSYMLSQIRPIITAK